MQLASQYMQYGYFLLHFFCQVLVRNRMVRVLYKNKIVRVIVGISVVSCKNERNW